MLPISNVFSGFSFVFALMKRKAVDSYVAVFDVKNNMMPAHIRVTLIMTDCEASLRRAAINIIQGAGRRDARSTSQGLCSENVRFSYYIVIRFSF